MLRYRGGGGGGGPRSPWVISAAAFLLAVAIVWSTARVASDIADGAADGGGAAIGASVGERDVEGTPRPDEARDSVDAQDPTNAQGVAEASAPEVSSQTFMEALDETARDASSQGAEASSASDDVAKIAAQSSRYELAWTEEGEVDVVATAVLRSYQERGDAILVTSGYLDLKGHVWGAVLWDGTRWVDIVLVSGAHGMASSEARVVRYAA